MSTFWAAAAHLPDGLAADVTFEITDGRFTAVRPDTAPGDARPLPGVVLPGFANAHSHAFHRALRIFDFFSYYEMAAILMLEKSLPVIVGTDHGADWSAPATDFESYWEFVLSQYGSVHARSEAFIKSRYGQAELRPDARAASLDEALTVCRRGWQE